MKAPGAAVLIDYIPSLLSSHLGLVHTNINTNRLQSISSSSKSKSAVSVKVKTFQFSMVVNRHLTSTAAQVPPLDLGQFGQSWSIMSSLHLNSSAQVPPHLI